MKGLLFKWHGYLSGWCEHFFILDTSYLSAYNVQNKNEENHALENINIGLCEIIVDHNDPLQWEIKTSNSKKWFMKAHSTNERQKWIQALGSCKACLLAPSFVPYLSVSAAPFKNLTKTEEVESSSNAEFLSNSPITYVADDQSNNEKEIEACNTENLKSSHRNLIQQCETVKSNIISIIDEILKPNIDPHFNFETLRNSLKELLVLIDTVENQSSYSAAEENLVLDNEKLNDIEENQFEMSLKQSEEDIVLMESKSTGDVASCLLAKASQQNLELQTEINNYSTFFSSCTTSFKDVMVNSVVVDSQPLLGIEIFLKACQSFSGLFGRFAKSLMSPLESDVQSNVEKIKKANASSQFIYVQELVSFEVSQNKYTGPDTATQALFWLNLSLQTIIQFLKRMFSKESKTYKITSSSFLASYEEVLKHHHNWMVQRLFGMGVKMLPDFHSFLVSMSDSSSLERMQQLSSDWEETVLLILSDHSLTYAEEIKVVSNVLCELFALHDIKH